MPPARRNRVTSGPAAKGSQKTLSFGNSKVTKPTSSLPKDIKSSTTIPPSKVEEVLDLGHISSEAAVEQQAHIEIEPTKKERTAEELKAEKVTDAQIKNYWREREAERKAPRVHQEGLSVEEKVLRLFDMSSQYGVSQRCMHCWESVGRGA
jgi:DNA polymerase delta subunit 4